MEHCLWKKQLRAISENALVEAGDVYIHGGSPGHAVIIIDIVENEENEKLFLLAQGYMPAQDMHILKNPTDPGISPWYKLPKKDQINTPEWCFIKRKEKNGEIKTET